MSSAYVYEILEEKNWKAINELHGIDFMDLISRLYYEYYSEVPYETLNDVQKTVHDLILFDDLLNFENDIDFTSFYINNTDALLNKHLPRLIDFFDNANQISASELIKRLYNNLVNPAPSLNDVANYTKTCDLIVEIESKFREFPESFLYSLLKAYTQTDLNSQKLLEDY